ncbi:MAG: sugar-transfer associated ATP-grasp domain-containing protein, partial [Pacificimonas sp.]
QALKGAGLPFPDVVAVAHAQRAFPGAARLSSLAETRAWLLDPCNYPFFGKPAAGTFGQSVCYALGVDVAANRIDYFGGHSASIEETANLVFSDRAHGYLLQQLVRSSAQMADIMGDVVPTARIISVMTASGVFLHQAVLRVPRGDLPTDNYAKGASGTGAAWIDIESGTLGPVHWGSGFGQKCLDDHPVTGARIAGFALPEWTDITEMLVEGHRYFPGLPLIGWDVAFSDEGPLILELNATSGYVVLQATGHGFVDDRLRAAIPLAEPTRRARFPRLNVSGSNLR